MPYSKWKVRYELSFLEKNQVWEKARGSTLHQVDEQTMKKLDAKLVLSGYEIKLGAIEAPSSHCWLVNTCWAMSSPTEHGTLIRDNLKK